MNDSQPWLFQPISDLPEHVRSDKKARQEWIQSPDTVWNYWTFHVGKNKAQRVSKSNPPNKSYGFAVDLDHAQAYELARKWIADLPFKPMWIEQSLSRKGCRLVFEFEEPVNMGNFGLAENMNKIFAAEMCLDALPGYDPKTTDPCMVWSNGAVWDAVEGATRIPSAKTFAWQQKALSAWNTDDKMGVAVPLDVAYALCKEKFGDRFQWPTESFELEQQGPTWFVEGSESAKSAVIKPHGIYSFSAHASDRPFRSWDDPTLLGGLVDKYKEANIEAAVRDVYFDGRVYFSRSRVTGEWVMDCKEVFARNLKVSHKLRSAPGKGQTCSELEQALNFVELNKRVAYATALMCEPPGIVVKDGKQVFNYAQPVIVEPTTQSVACWGDGFPFIAKFLDTVWDDPAGDEGTQKTRFLMSVKRLYESFSDFLPRRHAAMFFVGPKNIGKTFMSTGMLGVMLGGSNDPTSTLVEGNRFNSDMLGTPVWSLDDPQGTSANYQQFADMLKRFVANPDIRSEQKYAQGGMGAFNGIICVTMNDDASSKNFLPEVNRSNSDKWHFFKLKQSEAEFTKDENANKELLYREMPSFLRWLIDWQIPQSALQRFKEVSRWGHETYHHPELLTASQDGSDKMTYKSIMIRAFKSKCADAAGKEQLDIETPELLRSMNQAAFGCNIRFTPKAIERYLSEFIQDNNWPVRRVHDEHGMSRWNFDTRFFQEIGADATRN